MTTVTAPSTPSAPAGANATNAGPGGAAAAGATIGATVAAAAEAAEAAAEAHRAWAQSRHEAVTAPQGVLSLVLQAWAGAGEPEVSEAEARQGHPADAVFTRLQRPELETGEVQEGYRIWRSDSPAQQAFEAIEVYDYDPAWVIEGRFELVDEDRVVPIEHLLDGGATRELPVSGDLVFTHEGQEVRLAAFDANYGGSRILHLVFADQSNGVESYGTGRFLLLEHPATDELTTGGSVELTIDFNRVVVPPCGFSNQMNCPLPPLQNRLPFAVRAGERNVRFAEGFSLHG